MYECFFFRHVDLTSRFIVMSIDEVTLNRPEVGTSFSVLFCFCRFETLLVRLKVLHWDLYSLRFFPASEWVLGICSLSKTILLFHLVLTGTMNFFLISILLSRWFCEDKFPDASNFSKSAKSAIRISPLQIHPALSSHPRKIPDRTSLPSWWSPDWSRGEIGWYSTIARKRIIGPLNGSPKRLS